MSQKPHGLILAGMQSSSGKTAITSMLLATLKEQGTPIQSFKVGPDFIDPTYHSFYTQTPCINLDSWLMGKEHTLETVNQFGSGKVGVVEGVMGLFDGASPTSDEGSTFEIAQWLDWPIILVVPCKKVGRSIGAAIRGFLEAAGKGRIAGLILNQVNGVGHADYLKKALAVLDLPIVGIVHHNDALYWPERHLGLQARSEIELPEAKHLAELGKQYFDLEKIQKLVTPAPAHQKEKKQHPTTKIRIAVAKDEVFHFYYHANLEFLKSAGAELVEFSPLHDEKIPENIQGLVFGGGFPEVFAEQLSQNQTMFASIREAIESGLPAYAECGGLMLLTEGIISTDGKEHPMVGILSGKVQMTPSLKNFGYSLCNFPEENEQWRGHEFHYSYWTDEEKSANLWN
ncbi:MAG: cobyrinic acid a,c-diamide synthase, partial [bacterium]